MQMYKDLYEITKGDEKWNAWKRMFDQIGKELYGKQKRCSELS